MRSKILKEGSLLAGSTLLAILLSLYVIYLLGGVGGYAVAGYGIGYSIIFVSNRVLFGFRPGLLAATAKTDLSRREFGTIVSTAVAAAAATGLALMAVTAFGYWAYIEITDLAADTRRALQDHVSIAIWSIPLLGVGSALSTCFIRVRRTGRLFLVSLSLFALQVVAITLGVVFGADHIAPTKVPALVGLLSSLMAIAAYLAVLIQSGVLDASLPRVDAGRLKEIWINSCASGADAVVIAVTFMLVAMIASVLGTPEAAASATIITVLRLAIIPCKSFGVITGRIAAAEYASGHDAQGGRAIRAGMQVMYLLLAPVALSMIVWPEAISGFVQRDVSSHQAEMFRILLILAGLQILVEPIAGFLSTILKVLNRGARVLGNTALYQWLIALPAAYVTAVLFDWGLLALWLCMVGGRVIFAGLCLSAWRATATTGAAARTAPVQ